MHRDGMSISSTVILTAAAFLLIAGFYLWEDDLIAAIGCASAGAVLAYIGTYAPRRR